MLIFVRKTALSEKSIETVGLIFAAQADFINVKVEFRAKLKETLNYSTTEINFKENGGKSVPEKNNAKICRFVNDYLVAKAKNN